MKILVSTLIVILAASVASYGVWSWDASAQVPPPESVEEAEATDGSPSDQAIDESSDQPAGQIASPQPQDSKRDDAGWRLYHQAFERFVAGEGAEGRSQLGRLVNAYPGHPAAARAEVLLELLSAPGTPGAGARPTVAERDTGAEAASGLARAELAIFQTLHGIAVGAESCLLLAGDSCDSRPLVASLIAGGGTGLGLSLWLSADGVTPGQTNALDSGVLWGLWNAIALTSIADVEGTREMSGALLLGQVAGMGAGAVLYGAFEPRSGDVSLTNSGGLWAGSLAFLAHGAGRFEASDTAVWTTLLVASDLGGIAGAIASRHYRMSRARTLVIDSGGLLGGLIGIGTPVLLMGDDVEPEPVYVGGMVGIVSGLALTTYLTRDWDAEGVLDASLHLMPTEDGGAQVGLAGRW